MASIWQKKGLLIRIMGSIVLIYWVLQKIAWSKVIEVAKEGSAVYFFAALLAVQITVLSSVLKWKLLVDSSLDQEKKRDASLGKLGRFYYIGLFFNNFLPGSVGGDVIRVYYLGRVTGIPIATASVAFERLTSGAALVVIAIFSSIFVESSRLFLLPIMLVFGLCLLGTYLCYKWGKRRTANRVNRKDEPQTRIKSWILRVKSELYKISRIGWNYRKQGLKWWVLIALFSILFQVGLAWINDLLFLSLGINIPWLDLLMIITLISVITMLPISVNGLGVREGCYVLFFSELGVPAEVAVSVSLIFFILVSISSLAGGVFWVLERGKQR